MMNLPVDEFCDGCGQPAGLCGGECSSALIEYTPVIRYADEVLHLVNTKGRPVLLDRYPSPHVRVPVGLFEITRHGPRIHRTPVQPREWWED
jgi:hypothetical protein